MILYEYLCRDCGKFTAWNRMINADEPVACPQCRQPAQRMISAPYLADMDAHTRIAYQRNEKSAYEPRVELRTPGGQRQADCHQHRHDRGPSRPWMIGH